MEPIVEKKRRGRKAKIINPTEALEEPVEKIPKKRGRKPKGGKVVICQPTQETLSDQKVNIVLHLKCNKEDLESINKEILPDKLENFQFSDTKANDLSYMVYNTKNENIQEQSSPTNDTPNDNMKTIWQKLEKLSTNLHIDNICDKKSACFHCTCDFDNVPIYIPKYELNKTFYVYGCFCSPECACAHLMNEKSIDTTTRFERYQLLNFLYCKIYDYSKNIKPAPCPYYMLDKYYGSLSIQEYRKLLKNERLLLIVDKPLIRALPELHDDTDDYLLSYQGIPSSTNKYTLQRQTKQQSKNEILNEQFNLKT
jgi:hypothetical protein